VDLSYLSIGMVTSLPVDRRAVELLRAATSGEGREFFGNRRNIRLELEQYHWRQQNTDAARAYEEAFDWLAQHGLDPMARSPAWVDCRS